MSTAVKIQTQLREVSGEIEWLESKLPQLERHLFEGSMTLSYQEVRRLKDEIEEARHNLELARRRQVRLKEKWAVLQ